MAKKCKTGTVFVPIKEGRGIPGRCMTPEEYIEAGENINRYGLLPGSVNGLKAAIDVTKMIDKAIKKSGDTFNKDFQKAKKIGKRFRLGITDTATREEIMTEFDDRVLEDVDFW